jgi:hypothetical protein
MPVKLVVAGRYDQPLNTVYAQLGENISMIFLANEEYFVYLMINNR